MEKWNYKNDRKRSKICFFWTFWKKKFSNWRILQRKRAKKVFMYLTIKYFLAIFVLHFRFFTCFSFLIFFLLIFSYCFYIKDSQIELKTTKVKSRRTKNKNLFGEMKLQKQPNNIKDMLLLNVLKEKIFQLRTTTTKTS